MEKFRLSQLRIMLTSLFVFGQFFMIPGISYSAMNMTVLGQVQTGPAVSYVIEAGIVVLLFGGAIYAICKTSYRR